MDDSALSEVVRVGKLNLSTLQTEVDSVNQWSIANNMNLNLKRTREFIVSFLKNQPSLQPLMIDNQYLEMVQTAKLLGVYLTSDLKQASVYMRSGYLNVMAYNPVIFRRFIAALFVLFLNTRARYGTLPYRFCSATKLSIFKNVR